MFPWVTVTRSMSRLPGLRGLCLFVFVPGDAVAVGMTIFILWRRIAD